MADLRGPLNNAPQVSNMPSSAVGPTPPVSQVSVVEKEWALDRLIKKIISLIAKWTGHPDPITGKPNTQDQKSGSVVGKVWSTANKVVEKAENVASKTVSTATSVANKAVNVATTVVETATAPLAPKQENTPAQATPVPEQK